MEKLIALLKQHYEQVNVYYHPDTGQPCIYIVDGGRTYALVGFFFNGTKVYLP